MLILSKHQGRDDNSWQRFQGDGVYQYYTKGRRA
jgi:hypothetical protein